MFRNLHQNSSKCYPSERFISVKACRVFTFSLHQIDLKKKSYAYTELAQRTARFTSYCNRSMKKLQTFFETFSANIFANNRKIFLSYRIDLFTSFSMTIKA